jgi:hypothetical protein
MVDVVANYIAYDSTAKTVKFSRFNLFNEESYFYSICWLEDGETRLKPILYGEAQRPSHSLL